VKPEEMHPGSYGTGSVRTNVLVENFNLSSGVYFPTRRAVLPDDSQLVVVEYDVSQFSTTLLLVTALMLTACFGVAAWRTSGDASELEVTGSIASTMVESR